MPDYDLRLKAVLAILLVLGGLGVYRMEYPPTTLAADGSDPSWDAAARRSHDAGLPTVVIFTADWCPACRSLHGNVLSRGDVQQELQSHYGLHIVDLTHPSPEVSARAQKFGVRYIPQLIRYDVNGNETGRTNYLDAEQMIAWLKAGE